MKSFYAYINVDGVSTIIEFQYKIIGDGSIHLVEFFDRHGDTPDLNDNQEQLILQDIRQYERQSESGFQQSELSLRFKSL
ncbi:hypothetical protein [Gracilimonas sediminicola]|uniref:hypothetical protein n=1 Tax=Gracilimonas sediminicola TaxID=2952158 RepID=UPI0038D42243